MDLLFNLIRLRLRPSGFLKMSINSPFHMPIQGYTEVRYDEERKRVVYEPLQLTQAFRYVCPHGPGPFPTSSEHRLRAFVTAPVQELRLAFALGADW